MLARRVVLLVLLLGCKKKHSDEATAWNLKCSEATADGAVTEARAWLDPSQTSHWGFKVGTDQMRELTEAFYAAGAVQVRAAWSTLGNKQISALLIVDLPAEGRGPLFDKFAAIRESFELDAVPDVGQTCLLVGLD